MQNQSKYRCPALTFDFLPVAVESLNFLTPKQAILMGWLIRIYKFREQGRYVDEDGWFMCTWKHVTEGLPSSDNRPWRRQFTELVHLDLVEVEMHGNPAKRHIRLNFEKWEGLCFDSRNK